MTHKLSINAGMRPRGGWLWYVHCSCGWKPEFRSPTTGRWGRPDFDIALAVGIVHQKERISWEKLSSEASLGSS